MRADVAGIGKGKERGFFLIEAMVAILIFALGILGLVAMGSTAVASQSDAQYRTQAGSLADSIASEIALNINRATDATKAASLLAFSHQPAGVPTGAGCAFAGGVTAVPSVTALLAQAIAPGPTALPGATATDQQIVVDPAGNFNRVTITLCWRAPSDTAWRHHTLVTYVN